MMHDSCELIERKSRFPKLKKFKKKYFQQKAAKNACAVVQMKSKFSLLINTLDLNQ